MIIMSDLKNLQHFFSLNKLATIITIIIIITIITIIAFDTAGSFGVCALIFKALRTIHF
jgi:hypothetical protein